MTDKEPDAAPQQSAELSNLFISYAPEEQEFVRKLQEAFEARGRRVWVDWKREPAAESLAEQIRERIRAADYFALVLSPAALASRQCALELDEAASDDKQFFVLVRREVRAEDVPAALAGAKTIHFRREDDFAKSFRVFAALLTDFTLDVFISYARKDGEFADRIGEGLRKEGNKVWVDRLSIDGGDKWAEAIKSGIEAADNFVFVVTPDSLDPTRYCMKEVDYADEKHKRIIPVFPSPMDDSLVPAKLAEWQRVLFHEDDFEDGLRRLFSAVKADEKYVRDHTWLLNRAIEWGKHGHDPDFLLQGRSELDRGDGVVSQKRKKPSPSEEQKEYVRESKRARRRRIRFRAVLAFVVVAVVALLGYALVRVVRNWRQEERLKLSAELVNAARPLYDNQYDLALLLMLAANDLADTSHARDGLLGALQHRPRLITSVRAHDRAVSSLAYRPHTSLLAAGHEDGAVTLWDTKPERPVRAPTSVKHPAPARSLAFDGRGDRLAVGGRGRVTLWEVESGRQLADLPVEGEGTAARVAFSPDGRLLAATITDGSVIFWDAETGQRSGDRLSLGTSFNREGFDFAFSPDGRAVAVAVWDVVGLYDVGSRARRGEFKGQHETTISVVAFARDGSTLLSADALGKIVIWDVATRSPKKSFDDELGVLWASFDGDRLVSASGKWRLSVWNTAREAKPLTSIEKVQFTAVAHNDNYGGQGRLATGTHEGSILLWDISNPYEEKANTPAVRELEGTSSIYDVAASPDGSRLAAGRHDDFAVWRTGGDYAAASYATAAPVAAIAFVSDDLLAVGMAKGGEIKLWDTGRGQEVARAATGRETPVSGLAVSPDGRLLAAGLSTGLNNGGGGPFWSSARGSEPAAVALYDAGTLTPVGQPAVLAEADAHSLRFSPDGRRLAFATYGGREITVCDVSAEGLSCAQKLSGPDTAFRSLAFSPGGELLAAGGSDGAVHLWDFAAGRVQQALREGHAWAVTSVAFSPDGRLLASADEAGSAALWDVRERARVGGPIYGRHRSSTRVAFVAGDGVLATANNGVTLWHVSLDRWKAVACARAGRGLTAEECRKYLPGRQCPQVCRP
jgi:WD40 repeat protein